MTYVHSKPIRLVLFILAVLFAWGFTWPIMKMTLQHMPPLWMGAARFGIGSLVLFIFLLGSKRKFLPTKKDLPVLIIIGLFQMGVLTMLAVLGLAHVDAGRSAILVYTTPLWVIPIAVLFFKEPLSKLTFLGMILGITGVLYLFNPLSFDWSNHAALVGNGLLLLAAFVWAMMILFIRFSKHHCSPLELAPWQALIATIWLVIVACIYEPYPTIEWSWQLFAELAYLCPIATAFAYWGIIELNRKLPATTISLLLLVVPVIGLISSAVLLGEAITLNITIALSLILSGLICVILSKRKK